jgi:hypothetical protein
MEASNWPHFLYLFKIDHIISIFKFNRLMPLDLLITFVSTPTVIIHYFFSCFEAFDAAMMR